MSAGVVRPPTAPALCLSPSARPRMRPFLIHLLPFLLSLLNLFLYFLLGTPFFFALPRYCTRRSPPTTTAGNLATDRWDRENEKISLSLSLSFLLVASSLCFFIYISAIQPEEKRNKRSLYFLFIRFCGIFRHRILLLCLFVYFFFFFLFLLLGNCSPFAFRHFLSGIFPLMGPRLWYFVGEWLQSYSVVVHRMCNKRSILWYL